jgi:hypothetical protein
MQWLIAGAEVLGGAVAIAAGGLLTWAYSGGPSDIKHVMLVPIAALVLVVAGLSALLRALAVW